MAPLSNPWLSGPAPDVDCPRDMLEERILIGCTYNDEHRHAAGWHFRRTPVRYFSLGFEIMFTSWHESPKSRNLRRDPRISAAIVAPLVGQASSRDVHYGTAAITREKRTPACYWEAFRWQSEHVERGRDLTAPPTDPLTTSPRIASLHRPRLRRNGYRPRQIWTPAH